MSDPSPSEQRGRGALFWIAVGGGVLLLCCAGAGVAVWFGARDWIDIARAPEGERLAMVGKKLEAMAGDRIAAVDAFLAHVDAERADAAWEMTSSGLRAVTTREKFDEMIGVVRRVMGPLHGRELRNFQTKSMLGAGELSTLVFQGTYEKGEGTLTVELEREDGTWKVRSWHTASPRFLEELSGKPR